MLPISTTQYLKRNTQGPIVYYMCNPISVQTCGPVCTSKQIWNLTFFFYAFHAAHRSHSLIHKVQNPLNQATAQQRHHEAKKRKKEFSFEIVAFYTLSAKG